MIKKLVIGSPLFSLVGLIWVENNPTIQKRVDDKCKAEEQIKKNRKRIGKGGGANGLNRPRKTRTNAQRKLKNRVGMMDSAWVLWAQC